MPNDRPPASIQVEEDIITYDTTDAITANALLMTRIALDSLNIRYVFIRAMSPTGTPFCCASDSWYSGSYWILIKLSFPKD